MLFPRLPNLVRDIPITATSVTIQWILMEAYNPSLKETFVILYGKVSGQTNTTTPAIFATPTSQKYSTQISSLQPGAQYFYRVQSGNTYMTLVTDQLSFRTVDMSKYSL